jgi:hypothetical protein
LREVKVITSGSSRDGVLFRVLVCVELGVIIALIVASVGSMGSSSVFRLARGTDGLTKS